MKKKPSKLNSAKQTLLSKYLKPRPKSPELEVEIADNIVSKKEDLSEPIKATSGQGSLEQKSIENELECKENHVFVVPAVPITNNRKTVKGYRDLKTDGSKNRVERLKRLDALNVPNLEGSKKRVRESDASSVSPQMKKKKVIGRWLSSHQQRSRHVFPQKTIYQTLKSQKTARSTKSNSLGIKMSILFGLFCTLLMLILVQTINKISIKTEAVQLAGAGSMLAACFVIMNC
ncbi:unnamed protein product [Oikopleura dioica]|uniref:Uncharacterized protein n=1 Tax=Oikopleura dioica TaxID=34765 RepID=E4YQ50_OIKDI|nr:unnamed protein product [Oikopleura dioica]